MRSSIGSMDGFTLLEILVAILILAVVVMSAYGSFRALAGSKAAIGEVGEELTMLQDAISLIEEDLLGMRVKRSPAYRKPETGSDPDMWRVESTRESVGTGLFSRMRFVSGRHLPFSGDHRSGEARIRYWVAEDRVGHLNLYRKDDAFPWEEEGDDRGGFLVCRNLRTFELSWIDDEGEARPEWDSEGETFEFATPVAVRIRLALDSGVGLVVDTETELPVWRAPDDAS